MPADQPFVATPIGDEPAASDLAARLAARARLPRPQLLRAAMNATYVAGPAVVRVGRPTADATASYELAAALLAAGIRVPRPAAGRPLVEDGDGRVATAWERVEPGGAMDWAAVGAMVARLHRLDPSAVAAGYPTPLATTFPWWRFERTLEAVRPLLDERAFEALHDAVARNDRWEEASGGPAAWVLCHGDVHPHNVVFAAAGPVLLDWDLLCVGPPAWDHAPMRSMVDRWGADPAWYAEFARGYGDPVDERVAAALTELRSVAATLMRVLAEGPGRSPDSEAERRLRFWRGDPDAPTWRVV